MKNLLAMLFIILFVGANGAMAANITPTVLTDLGSSYNTAGLTGYATDGDMMDGMVVTVQFVGGGTDSAVWADTGTNAGAATGIGWSLALTGNSNVSAFSFVNSSAADIAGFIIDATPGMTVFDFYFSPDMSPGSSGGGNILNTSPSGNYVIGPDGMSVTGTYRNSVAINGTFYGDLYGVLDIAMVSATGGGLASGQTLKFYTDTDNAATAIIPTPEPASMLLLGLGLVGLVGLRRKIQK